MRETRVLPIQTCNRVRVDLIFTGLPIEEQAIRRARDVLVGQRPVRVCSPEDLIVYKIVSERPRDREDIKGVFRHQGARLDFDYLDPIISELAIALERPDMWEYYEALKRSVTGSD